MGKLLYMNYVFQKTFKFLKVLICLLKKLND